MSTQENLSNGAPIVNNESTSPAAFSIDLNGQQQQQQHQQHQQSSTIATASSASLYVGELDPSITEAMLFEMFNVIGPVASIRVCRDAVTRRSLGYAYVNFHNLNDAERALESLNYSLIKGRACRIMWSQRDPALRKTGDGNIFIKNLDPTIDNKALHDTFSAFGNILSCKIAQDEAGKSKGYGFVHYETQEAAEKAIKSVNNMLLNDKQVYVGYHIPRKERQSKTEDIRFTNVYVKNLSRDVDDKELDAMFKVYGDITSAVVSKDEEGKSLGFGFVNFEDHDAAARAVEGLNESMHNDQKLYVSRAQKKTERDEELRRQYEEAKLEKLNKYQGVNLYVKNLDDDMDDDRIRQEFSVYGVITSAKVMCDDKTGKSRGFGFVCFSSPDEATRAVTEMNGRMLGSKPIYVALAQRKEERRVQLGIQMAQRNQMSPVAMGMGMPHPIYLPNFMPQQSNRPIYTPTQGWPPHQSYPRPPRNPRPPRDLPSRSGPRGAGELEQSAGASNVPNAQKPSLTASSLAAAAPEVQKQMLGERLYPLIEKQEPENAGKITGMLLEMDNDELLRLVGDEQSLQQRVQEAKNVLKQHSLAIRSE
ncbi:hypothetical protein [Parasitella parasitica]|uniref:Polyadenylate-binding protein n=1 Tax=Parasitella parasitica TaxID=35722 RepID=A0A0B7N9B2_9FUNG|nr:hypothetical protein [Parasitella parasitica]